MVKKTLPPQHQSHQPGCESKMVPKPKSGTPDPECRGKLQDKVALITGGDSGIGRAVAYAFAKEGAKIAIVYLEEHKDAEETKKAIEKSGGECLLIAGDIGEEKFCQKAVKKVLDAFHAIHILVNNAAEQHVEKNLEDITQEQLIKTFRTNIFSYFYFAKAVLPHFNKGCNIINTASVVAYKGNPLLMDYAATKGAIVAFTRSLSMSVVEKGIRVNGVAPGPIWTPLIPASFSKEHVAEFGKNTPMKRPGQPEEVAPAYVFLASEDASYISGQIIHINGGTIVNG